MKKILIIMFSIIALLVVGWFGVYQVKAPEIQSDIEKRVGEALTSNSLDWVSFETNGRDVILSGTATNQQMVQNAVDTADVYGLRSLTNNILLVDSSNEPEAVVQQPEIDNKENTSSETNTQTDVAVQETDKTGVAALPLTMAISKDIAGEFIFNGTVPDADFKGEIDQHLAAVGADSAKAVWQIELSSAEPTANWKQNVLNSISAVQMLQEGEVTLSGKQADFKGLATSQDASDTAEAFAQKIAGDYTTNMSFSIVEVPETKTAEADVEDLPLVGSDKYAVKFCQTGFNGLLKNQKIVFESGSSKLESASSVLLEKIAKIAARCSTQGIQVNGYTDSRGAASANWKLSKLRAEAVVSFLVQKGIDNSRLRAIGHGEKNPIATNKTEAGRAKNRRIKLIVKRLKK